MESNEKISRILAKSTAYKDLGEPVILNIGELGIYFINTQYSVGDPDVNKKIKEHGNNSSAMINYSIEMMDKNPDFKDLINILAEDVNELLKKSDKEHVIAGGQRRDWPFSGAVAHVLGVPHVSLYKDGKMELIDKNKSEPISDLSGVYALDIVDLITGGSSIYRIENDQEMGWIPMIRNAGGEVNDCIAIVDRLQGGERNLAKQGVALKSYVYIDENFLKNHSKQPDVSVAYNKDPHKWSEDYMAKNGVDFLVKYFNPEDSSGKTLEKAKRFLDDKMHGAFLKNTGLIQELESKVQQEYGKSLNGIVGGK